MTLLLLSGLPASGKSTLARVLSAELDVPMVDKDEILERLFRERGVGDAAWRTTLSRDADLELRHQAITLARGILVSWWRHPRSVRDSGTPVDWFGELAGVPLEVHCVCDPSVAARRFLARQRHQGHLDRRRGLEDLTNQFTYHASHGPLGVGPCVTVSTLEPVEIKALLSALRAVSGSTLFDKATP